MSSAEITYSAKMTCSVCSTGFSYEKLLSKKVAPRRQDIMLKNHYDSTVLQDPLIYMLVTCPRCLYTASEADFPIEDIRHRSDVRELSIEATRILRSLNIQSSDYGGLRDLKLGLGTYYMAEFWYSKRDSLPSKHFKLGLNLYRRMLLLEQARQTGVISDDLFRQDWKHCLENVDSCFEHSYLKERLPDSTYYGPDYGINHGHLAVPYMIAVANHFLTVESGDVAERIAHNQKAMKFIGITQAGLGREKMNALRGKLSDLKTMVKNVADAGKLASETSAPADLDTASRTPGIAPGPQPEIVHWNISFEMLYDRYGKEFAKDTMIIREGEQSQVMYLILEGGANVVKTFQGEQKLIAVLGKGAFFGEMSLLDPSPRLASVVATDKTRVIVINRLDLESLIRTYPEIALSILSVLVRRIRNYDAFVQHRLMDLVPEDKPPSKTRHNLTVELVGLMAEVQQPEEYD